MDVRSWYTVEVRSVSSRVTYIIVQFQLRLSRIQLFPPHSSTRLFCLLSGPLFSEQ